MVLATDLLSAAPGTLRFLLKMMIIPYGTWVKLKDSVIRKPAKRMRFSTSTLNK